jgi:RNA polymerase sigma-70 factor (ECF subfamily)
VTSDNDRRVFEEVVLPHLDDACRFARWLTGNASDAEDVVQEACLRALTGASTYAGGSKRAWLIAIVRNTAFTWLARNRPKSLVLTGDMEEAERASTDLPPVATPEAEVIARADQALLTAGIEALPAPFRETLVLREINDLSYREIAEATGVPVGTVMSRLARARALLIERIGKEMA